jgi:hypothetical protein
MDMYKIPSMQNKAYVSCYWSSMLLSYWVIFTTALAINVLLYLSHFSSEM